MGRAIKHFGWKRSDLVISTKIYWGGSGTSKLPIPSWLIISPTDYYLIGPNDRGLSRKHIIEGMKASLERLQLDYVDLVFAHRPDNST